ncbi:MAG: glycosyltransferase, partial [Planctomycetaceae bacterium]|nr:glycosyltransferase [Planctomycetaceae bacterium]
LFSANTYARLPGIVPRGVPVIVSERCVDSWKSGWQLAFDRKLRDRMSAMTANSESVKSFYAETVGVAPERIVVIPNAMPGFVSGVDAGTCPTAASPGNPQTSVSLRRDFGLPRDARVVGFVGRLAPQKRVTDLVWAFQLLQQVMENVRLVLIGDGPERNALAEFAKGLGCRDLIVFAGHQPRAMQYLQQLDVFCLPSSFEGMSNSLMEAMAAGVPVVASDIEANRELIEHNVTGLVVPVGNGVELTRALRRLLQDQQLCHRLSSAARRLISERHTVELLVRRHMELYGSALCSVPKP